MTDILCPICKKTALRITGAELAPERPELAANRYFYCREDQTVALCHPNTWQPIHRMACPHPTLARQHAMAAFNRLIDHAVHQHGWTPGRAKGVGYGWLANKLQLPRNQIIFNNFTVQQCARVIDLADGADLVRIAGARTQRHQAH